MRELNDLSSVADLGTCFYITSSSMAMLGEVQNYLKPFRGTGSWSAQVQEALLAEIHQQSPVSTREHPMLTQLGQS